MINLKRANIYYNKVLEKQKKKFTLFKNLLKRKPYLICCNIFDRDPNPSNISALNTMFSIGLHRKILEERLLESLCESRLHIN